MDKLTKLKQLINPEVMTDMISADLPKGIKFSAIAPIDTTLEKIAGDTVTFPRFKYIGDAKDVAEGEAIDYSQLETSTDTFTVKKAGKGVKLTDEAVLNAHGDVIGEAVKQIGMALASKIDNDIVATATKSRLTLATASFANLDFIDKLEDTFGDDESEMNIEANDDVQGVIFLNKKDLAKVRKAAGNDWTRATELGDRLLTTGVLGEVLGWQFKSSRKIPVGSAIVAKPGAMITFLNRGVESESGRDMDSKLTKFNADVHYGVGIYDDTKLLVIKPFKYDEGTVIEGNVPGTDEKPAEANK